MKQLRSQTIAVLGAGNGGLAIAGALANAGYKVRLWNRNIDRLDTLRRSGGIRLTGIEERQGFGQLDVSTSDLVTAIDGASHIFVVTTADAHESLAQQLAPILHDGQRILLNPGRTAGALVMRTVFDKMCPEKDIIVGEAQSLVFACRAEGETVRIIGEKKHVPVAACPGRDTIRLLDAFQPLFPCFRPVPTILHTGFENIGAIFHPAIVIFNAAKIERGESFYFYQDMTPHIADFLGRIDEERIAVAAAYGIQVNSIFDWIQRAYPATVGNTLCERLRYNPAYGEILSPKVLASRLLTEDLPTGLVPLYSFGQAAAISMPLTRSLVDLGGALLDRDFWNEGRNLANLGLDGLTSSQIIDLLN